MKQLFKDIVAPIIGAIAGGLVALTIMFAVDFVWEYFHPVEKSSSFVCYSQSCWQVGDTLHVVTAKGDTVRLDVSRLEGE